MKTFNAYYRGTDDLGQLVATPGFRKAMKGARSVLVQIFCGVCDRDFIRTLISAVRSHVPRARIIGATTAGEIMDGEVSALTTVLSFTIFEQTDIRSVLLEKSPAGDFELGRAAARELAGPGARCLILFGTPTTIDGNQMLNGVSAVAPDMLVAGGQAGDNGAMRQTFVFTEAGVTDHGLAGVSLVGESLRAQQHWHLSWQPIGKQMTVTRARDARVYTIDDMPAYQVYHKYLGAHIADNFYTKVLEFPLMCFRHGMQLARVPVKRHADDSLSFVADIHQGEKVMLSFGNVPLILAENSTLREKLLKAPVESIFAYSCSCRRGLLQESTQIETMHLQEIAPTAGLFTYGEYYHDQGRNELLNSTLALLVLSESAELPRRLDAREAAEASRRAGEDVISNKHTAILGIMTHLVNTVTGELNERNAELARKNKELIESQQRADRIFSALAQALPGSTLDGKYLLETKIGSGAFGVVFQGRHLGLRRPVAIKVFRPRSGNDSADALERFRQEAISMGRIRHPNAVGVIDSGVSSEGIAYLVMELLEGRSLADEMREQGRLSLRRAREILVPVCSVLDHAHELGLLHRDIKPENIFLHRDETGEVVKVVDFGIAKWMPDKADAELDQLTQTGAVIGTPAYVAPERIVGASYDGRADVYSLGVVLYQMLSGRHPLSHGGAGPGNWLVLSVVETPMPLSTYLPDVPAGVQALLDRALDKAPNARPSARAFAEALEAALDGVSDEHLDAAMRFSEPLQDQGSETIDDPMRPLDSEPVSARG